jgi:hypothetical protein
MDKNNVPTIMKHIKSNDRIRNDQQSDENARVHVGICELPNKNGGRTRRELLLSVGEDDSSSGGIEREREYCVYDYLNFTHMYFFCVSDIQNKIDVLESSTIQWHISRGKYNYEFIMS